MLAPALRQLDFATEGGELAPGLVPVRLSPASTPKLDEILAVRDAVAIGGIDYILFRRFADHRSSQVAAYVVDNERGQLTEAQLAELHKRVWLHGGVPLIFVSWPARVDVLSCARGPDFWSRDSCNYNPAERINQLIHETMAVDTALKELRGRYSAWRLVDGTFWDDPRNARLANGDDRAHEALIRAVVETDEILDGKNKPLLRRLLLLTVLIKYLEDRRVFPVGWFAQFSPGAESFLDTLGNGNPTDIVRLLKELEQRFNGDLFILPGSLQSTMTKDVLERFAALVEARTIAKQRYLWEQFSFEHIPVEIVSHLYQRFVGGGHGQVYTPPFLASLLLDFAMPYATLRGTERILDPACGSGVFLVGAFRRLVNVWRSRNDWASPSVAQLKQIVRKCIFGIDLDPGAIDLAAFSLAVAICDSLKPDVIWRDLQFDPLRNSNLIEGDFFSDILGAQAKAATICNEAFDVILGNPPFESQLTTPGEILDRAMTTSRGTLPDKQAAYLFLEQAVRQLRPGGRLCLLQPSSILYNRKAVAFRERLFRDATVECVLDFTSIRKLFAAADPKTAAFLIVAQRPSDDHSILHVTLRRTFATRQRIAFEIDHYDRHRVPQQVAVEDSFIWRLNLLGGGRLISMSRRFRSLGTLATFVETQGLSYGEGFIVGNRKNAAPFLTGMRRLPAEALTSEGIDESRITVVTETHFEGPRVESLYQPPVMLVRKNESLPFAFWTNGPLAFSSTIVGIGVGKSPTATLKHVVERFAGYHRTYRLCCMLHGSKAFVAKATAILKQDIDALPYPEEPADLALSFWEEAIQDDVLDYICDFVRLGQNAELLKSAATLGHLADYTRMFFRMLGTVYDNLAAGAPQFFDGLICQPFYFGENGRQAPVVSVDVDKLRQMVYDKHHESLRTVRMVRFYQDSAMVIVKPDRLRYWLRSAAIWDADETIGDLRRQGY